MKSLILFPFRLLAFLIRLILLILAIPLIILFRLGEIIMPEIFRPLRQGVSTVVNVFKF